MAKQKHYLGIDIGSTTFKAVIMTEDGKVEHVTYQRTKPVESGRVPGQSPHTGRAHG